MKSKAEIEKTVAELGTSQPWNHRFELPFGVVTSNAEQVSHGKNLVKWDRINPILDEMGVAQNSVLDLGSNEGFFSFALADRGCRVVGVDVDSKRIEKANYIKEILGYDNVNFENINVYSPDFERMERFDIVLCLGVVHRVPDPFRLLEALSSKADILIIEWKALKFGDHDQPIAFFSPKSIDIEDFYGTEYWLVSFAALERMLRRVGMDRFYRLDDPRQRRGIMVAGRIENPIFLKPDQLMHRGRLRTALSHLKRFVRIAKNIANGRLNA
ncbi:class I SAM-dependent methyltransferase [Aurantimonas sp. C2-6-R+9]|uniref:class I SAM-dependent methyltransferase n=1 Tax=unclassified Aurantimonas TaxID=2638230 RepID=UPI002E16DCAF|nr:class I SAM-dependent methyltransferase [Aurantimonas sp. C2-6-R+9]